MRIEIYRDSVVFQDVDAIVNAANVTLLGGGGVDGAIHDAAGPKLYWYFHDLKCTCQPGEAIESPGFNLPARHIIDKIDELLAKHYGFTEEELDFIINYDIKYRMGNALESEARREGSSEAKNGEAARKGPHQLNGGE